MKINLGIHESYTCIMVFFIQTDRFTLFISVYDETGYFLFYGTMLGVKGKV